MRLMQTLDLPTHDDATHGPGVSRRAASSSPYASLVARIFPPDLDALAQPSRVIAVIGAHKGAGVTHVCTECAAVLNDGGPPVDSNNPLTVCIDYRRLAERQSDLRYIVTAAIGPEMLYQRKVAGSTISSLLNGIYGDWLTDARHRAKCITKLKEVFNYVLVDCPSVKEGPDLRLLAPLVDGIVVVVEADRTTEKQLAYLLRTIQEAGGVVLGLVLNKRHYAIPQTIYRRLETAGMA